MPISHTLDRERRQVSTFVDGAVSVRDILGHMEAVRLEEALPYAELIDATAAGPQMMSPVDVWNAAKLVLAAKLPRPFGPRAVIVRDDLAYGLVRIFTNLVSGFMPFQAFRNRRDAEAWLAECSPLADGSEAGGPQAAPG